MWHSYKVYEKIRITEMYSLFEAEYNSGFSFAGESHNFWECVYVISGSLRVSSNRRVYEMTAGNLIFHKPLEIHKFDVTGTGTTSLLIFSFSMDSEISDFFKNKMFLLDNVQQGYMNDFTDFLRKENSDTGGREKNYILLFEQSDSYSQMAVSYIYRIFLSLCERNIASVISESPDAAVFSDAVNFMNGNLDKELSVNDIACSCSVSISLLKRTFLKYSGMGVHKYFLKMKINTASSLLENGNSVSETAEKLGFSSQPYFSYVFKRETGTSPSVYRYRTEQKLFEKNKQV